ncbi:uncharacterized protein LOC121833835 [Ixodes scapularis]|uniref:uncharacterized protein LOC121833835 n=1 Tax=Ixodes scapularis TaxID=6945 RepID=UPI001C389437|nr:uncharacterized protein LOC121833835 [Ixodes scapularis]
MLLPTLTKFKQASDKPGPVICSVFLRGKFHKKCAVMSPDEAQAVLNTTHSLGMCTGCGLESSNGSRYVSFAGSTFSVTCKLTCDLKGRCIHCKYLRKLVQNQMSRKKRPRATVTLLRMHANTRRRSRSAQKKLLNAEKELEEMRVDNEQIADEVLNDCIKGLPPNQQMAVRTCFKAATRKSTFGMNYEKEWILECVLLRMRSPKLYKHLRRHKILVLPSRTCMQRYVRNFKSGFGFNDSVFKALALKTPKTDICTRHGGIVFDELKLSEALSTSVSTHQVCNSFFFPSF